VEFDVGQATKSIQLASEDLVAEAADVYDHLADRVAAARRRGGGLAVRVGSVMAGLSGATERLAQIAGVRVVELPAGAGALGALACAKDIRSGPSRTTLVKSLGWRAPAGRLPSLRPDELDDSVSEATHLLISDTAHPIGEGDLNLRFGETGRPQVIAERGDDRTDFALRRSGGGLQLEYAGDVGVLVNARPAESGTRLQSGDRIAVAGSTEEAQLITVNSDGP
jgi:hypothetical protein